MVNARNNFLPSLLKVNSSTVMSLPPKTQRTFSYVQPLQRMICLQIPPNLTQQPTEAFPKSLPAQGDWEGHTSCTAHHHQQVQLLLPPLLPLPPHHPSFFHSPSPHFLHYLSISTCHVFAYPSTEPCFSMRHTISKRKHKGSSQSFFLDLKKMFVSTVKWFISIRRAAVNLQQSISMNRLSFKEA